MDFHGRLIGITGRAKVGDGYIARYAGKDTVAQAILKLDAQARAIAFADPIKQACKEWFDFTEDQLHGNSKETPDRRYPRAHEFKALEGGAYCIYCSTSQYEGDIKSVCSYLTPREAMQLVGTEIGRRCYADIWVDYAFRRAAELLFESRIIAKPVEAGTGTSGKGSSIVDRCSKVFVTDVRFLNEAKMIREAGGLVWRVTRPSGALTNGQFSTHASEGGANDPAMDQFVTTEILNDGTLADLEQKVQHLIIGI